MGCDVDYNQAVNEEIADLSLITPALAEPPAPSRKKQKSGAAGVSGESEYRYATIATEVRAMYEETKDWHRSELMIYPRKPCRSDRFNCSRLRALQ